MPTNVVDLTLEQVNRRAAIQQLMIAADQLGFDFVDVLLQDIEAHGIAAFRRWFSTMQACQRRQG